MDSKVEPMVCKVGVLALQGDFMEHVQALRACHAQAVPVRIPQEIEDVDGLIIPGGESTTIAKLTSSDSDSIFDTICRIIKSGVPVYGTCMGAIFLAKEIENSNQGKLGLMDIKIRRNAFGPQCFSFERELVIPSLGDKPYLAVFIRAPLILSCLPNVEVIASISEGVVMAKQDNMLVSAFHPELTSDLRIHKYFLNMVYTNQKIYKR